MFVPKIMTFVPDKKYAADLMTQGIPEEKILKYGFAFQGERCLIKKNSLKI